MEWSGKASEREWLLHWGLKVDCKVNYGDDGMSGKHHNEQRQGDQDMWDGGGNEGTMVGPSGGIQGQVGKL